MESLSPLDEVSKYPNMLLAADMTEYSGGDCFDTAESVVVSQLKYSQRHPDKKWTAARLSASNSRGRPGIVERLADIFKIHLEEHGRDTTVKKLRLRVVSNQPASPVLIAALKKAGVKPEQLYASLIQNGKEQASADKPAQQQAKPEFKLPDPSVVFKVPVGNGPVVGPKTAKVTIIEYSDFQCPFCSRVGGTLAQIRKTVSYTHLTLPTSDLV